MAARKVRLLLAGMAALLIPLGAVPATASADPVSEQVRTIYYDATGAEEFQDAVDAGAAVWNEAVPSIKLEKGGEATIEIVADDGWPRAQTIELGVGTIWFGRQAVTEGHDTTRIAAHELGHILGLPDDRTGLCEDLMSGASAGPECKNPQPNAAEIAQVEENFAGTRDAASFRGTFDETPLAVG
ncbi:peptidase [Amycolatopsis antarctica]|uniref:Extracellular small neutral protease n=1 Tax=Amycolatopsis antarctica TaxID=1854586 RepID=A0A263CWM8_9PSEU|nr:snapalysin family zinc-dependent metalloprotease [Amycolatopsis antarctica]OZM70550.1 peptidase [Amycolatopsis antarctica]